MPGLVPGIHDLPRRKSKNVDGRDKPGHDDIPFSSAGGHQIKYCFVMISPSLELSVMNS
ncbi:hypothetical protein ABIF65_004521 [Bradyrhizobium japonicum]|nr:hypothetical protein [Bradyrhizobium japonicum]MCP1781201.1 hypothetical protein [Bradyrhizobium japonicum]MCP1860557.1 hypothetical protein [Bradyrhizobium japonicum]MCP1891320.1 hypothetical protein [Bradyrhizobium japonicum]MCP1955808.1 hypothetical protein [Bradyrhizobium japonicum]